MTLLNRAPGGSFVLNIVVGSFALPVCCFHVSASLGDPEFGKSAAVLICLPRGSCAVLIAFRQLLVLLLLPQCVSTSAFCVLVAGET